MNEQLEPCPFCGHAMMYFGDDCSWNVFDTNIRCPVQPSLLHNLETREAAIAAWNTRAPVESVTVSGERKWNRATVNEVGYQLGLAHAEGRVTSRELTHTVEFVLDNAVRVGLVVPAPPLSPATPSVTVEAAVRAAREWWIREHGHGVEGVRKLVDESDIEECVRFLSLPRAPAKEASEVEASASVVEAARALMRAIDPATYRTSWREFKVHSSAYESEFMALHKALAASPRSAVEAEVVEAAKAVHEAGSVLARHFNGPFAVWTAWNVACETLDRALARAQEGRGT